MRIDYAYGDLSLKGFFAYDEGARDVKRAGVLVIHDAGGLSENIKEKTRRLATLGYASFALDLFGGSPRVTDGMATHRDSRRSDTASAAPPWWIGR